MQSFDTAQLAEALKTPRPKRQVLAVAAAVLALLMLAASVTFPDSPTDAETGPHTATAVIGDIEATVLASGTLQASEQVNVGAQVSGQVTSLKVALGQHVKKGDLIAEIDSTSQKNEQRNAEAALKSLEAQIRAKQISSRQAASALQRH